MVARCAVHEVAFTVYPPSHVPYGRRALAACSPCGEEPSGPNREWDGSVFAGAVAAAEGAPWARAATGGTDEWWSTQGRVLERAMVLTGTHPQLSDALRHRIAETLLVPALFLRQQAAQISAKPGFVSRGRAVVAILHRLVGPVVRRMLVVGALVGLWGRPLWWDGLLRPLAAFPCSGTDPPATEPGCRDDPRK